jgi:hypothetical protein
MKLELTLDEVNGIMMALGNMPYVQVESLIDKIRTQVIQQVQAEGKIPVEGTDE